MNDQTKNLICLLLTDPDPDVRRRAAEDLAEFSDRNIFTVLSIALEDENKGVEDAVARSFLNIGGVAAARSIVHHIEDENIVSRNLSAKLLIKLGEASIHAIVPYLRDANKDVRKIAVDILGEIRSKEPLHYIIPLLKDNDPNVLAATLEALGNIGSSEAIDPICESFDQFPFAQVVAIEALGKIGGDSARDYIESKFKEAMVAGAIDRIYLFALLDAMGTLGDGETLEVLLANYESIKEPLRDVLIHDVVQISERCNLDFQFEDNARDDLLHALHSYNNNVQLSAAKGLAQFKDQEVTKALLQCLGISEEMDFVVVIQMADRPKVFKIAVECFEKGMSQGKSQIIMLLGKLATEYVRSYSGSMINPIEEKELNRAFTITSEYWREATQEDWEIIADTLFRLDCERASTFLYGIMIGLDPWSRVHMINQLAIVQTHHALNCIVRFADDENEAVREAVALAAHEAEEVKKEKMKSGRGKSPNQEAEQRD
jgi:HEAT repeat protein